MYITKLKSFKSPNRDQTESGLLKAYRKQIIDIDDGNFTNIDSDGMRIISNGVTYIPSDKDQGEFIVWKKDGAIYNMFNQIKSDFDQEISSVKVTPAKISINNNQKKASNRQIKEIFKIHSEGMPLGKFNIGDISKKMVGYTGADVESVCREAALTAMRESKKTVTKAHFENALNMVRPTVNDDMLEYYKKMEALLVSGLSTVRRGKDTQRGMESV